MVNISYYWSVGNVQWNHYILSNGACEFKPGILYHPPGVEGDGGITRKVETY